MADQSTPRCRQKLPSSEAMTARIRFGEMRSSGTQRCSSVRPGQVLPEHQGRCRWIDMAIGQESQGPEQPERHDRQDREAHADEGDLPDRLRGALADAGHGHAGIGNVSRQRRRSDGTTSGSGTFDSVAAAMATVAASAVALGAGVGGSAMVGTIADGNSAVLRYGLATPIRTALAGKRPSSAIGGRAGCGTTGGATTTGGGTSICWRSAQRRSRALVALVPQTMARCAMQARVRPVPPA